MNENLGSYCLVRVKVRGAFSPIWNVRVSLPGEKVRPETAAKFVPEACRICADCLAVPADRSPGKERAGCECQKGIRRFYDGYLKKQAQVRGKLVRSREFGRLDELALPRGQMLFGEIVPLIRSKGPKGSREKNLGALRQLVEGIFGVELEAGVIEELTWRRIIGWARMYQEYGRRQWTERGKAPVDAWKQLRCLLHAGSLPELDVETVAPWNTTIRTVVRMVKACLGPKARSVMLLSVADRMPVLPWTEPKRTVLALPCPKGRQFEQTQYEAFWKALPELRKEDPRKWLYVRLALKLGSRPREPLAVRQNWLKADESGRVILVLKNRPEEGFLLKARERGQVRPLELESDVVEVIEQVMCGMDMTKREGKGWKRGEKQKAESGKQTKPVVSVLGCRTKTDGEKLYRAASKWIRQFVPTGSATLYLLRHNAITTRAVHEGAVAATAAAGHAMGSAVTLGTYVEPKQVIAPLSDARLAPEAVFSRPLQPWSPGGGRKPSNVVDITTAAVA